MLNSRTGTGGTGIEIPQLGLENQPEVDSQQSAKQIVLNSRDMIMHLSNFLHDYSSYTLFNTFKSINLSFQNNINFYKRKCITTSQLNKIPLSKRPTKICRLEVDSILDDMNYYENIYVDEIYFKDLSIECRVECPFETFPYPKGVKLIVFENFNEEIKNYIFPDTLEAIDFSDYFNQHIPKEIFPPTLQKICVDIWYDLKKDNVDESYQSLLMSYHKFYSNKIDKEDKYSHNNFYENISKEQYESLIYSDYYSCNYDYDPYDRDCDTD